MFQGRESNDNVSAAGVNTNPTSAQHTEDTTRTKRHLETNEGVDYIFLSSRGRRDRPGVPPLRPPRSSAPPDSSSLHHRRHWPRCHREKQIPGGGGRRPAESGVK